MPIWPVETNSVYLHVVQGSLFHFRPLGVQVEKKNIEI